MVVDLDVHQGNGVERDKLHYQDQDLYIVDMYNSRTFPLDTAAKAAINVKVSQVSIVLHQECGGLRQHLRVCRGLAGC